MKKLLTLATICFVMMCFTISIYADVTEAQVAALKQAQIAAKNVETQKATAKAQADSLVTEKQSALDSADAQVATKQAEYDNAPEGEKQAALAALQQAQAEQQTAQQALVNAQNAAAQADSDLVNAQSALAEANTALDAALAEFDQGSVNTTNYTDPEIDEYLDRAFPIYGGKGVVILSAYYDDFTSYGGGTSSYTWFEIIAHTLASSSAQYVGQDAEGQEDTSYGGRFDRVASGDLQVWQNSGDLQSLRSNAITAYQDTYGLGSGAIPTRDWSFVIDLDTQEILHAFRASDFTSGSDGTYQFNRGGNYGFTTHRSSVGKTLVVDNGQGGTTEYKVVGAVQYSPIIIDLNGDGKPGTSRNIWKAHWPAFFSERTAIFDMSGTGRDDLVEWLGTSDGLLVKPEADGSVKNALNLFGTAGGYKDGYEKMSKVLDLDKNGWVEKDELHGLYIWVDKNGNAKVDKGEMKTVQEYGIERISVKHKEYQSVCYIKGKKVMIWDWWPTGKELMVIQKTN